MNVIGPRTPTPGPQIAMGYLTAQGTSFRFTDDPEADWLLLPTLEEALSVVDDRFEDWHLMMDPHMKHRAFRIWTMPWQDAEGPDGETWQEGVS